MAIPMLQIIKLHFIRVLLLSVIFLSNMEDIVYDICMAIKKISDI